MERKRNYGKSQRKEMYKEWKCDDAGHNEQNKDESK
jgi:hypothetical protein